MTVKPVERLQTQSSLLKLATPLIISFWFRSLFPFVDLIYASCLGDAAVAAVGFTYPLEMVMLAVWVGFSTAFTSYFARAVGHRGTAEFRQLYLTAEKLICCAIPLFILLGVSLYVYPYWAVDIHDQPAVIEGFRIYASVLVIGTAMTNFWTIIPDAILKAHHDTYSTMMAGILGNLVNLLLNTLFLFGFGWGLFGLALATALGRLTSFVYSLRRANILERERMRILQDQPEEVAGLLPRPISTILFLAFPTGLFYLLMAFESRVLNFLLAGLPDNTSALAAFQYFYRLLHFALMPLIATTVATLPFVTRHAQEGNLALVHTSYHFIMGVAGLYSIFFVAPLYWIAAGPLMHWLAQEAATVKYGLVALQMVPLFCLVAIPYQFSRPIFEGFQQGWPTLYMSLLRYLGLSIPLGYLGQRVAPRLGYSGFMGLMSGLCLATLISSLIFWSWAESFLRQAAKKPPQPKR